MVAVRPVIKPFLAVALIVAALLVLAVYEVGVLGGVGRSIVPQPHPAAPVTTNGPEDAGPDVVSQSPAGQQPGPAKVTTGGPEDAGPGVVYQGQSGGYSSTSCGPRPCKP